MNADVVVVGGGIMGLATAWRLALAGRETVLLERHTLAGPHGSSHGATRIFRFAYDDPTYVRMAQAALPLWRDLEEHEGELLTITGGLDLGPPGSLRALVEAQESCGVHPAALDAAAVASRFPWLNAPGAPAVWSPDTGVIAAEKTALRLVARARHEGARISDGSAVERLAIDDEGVTVHLDGEQISARAAVVTAGAWMNDLLEPLGVRLPLRVTREQVFYFGGSEVPVPWIDRRDRFLYGMPGLYRAAGVKVAEHEAGKETSGDGRSYETDPDGAARIVAYVRESLPGLQPIAVAAETCLYTNTPDEHFVIDRVGPVVFGSICSGHGFKFAPLIGETLARLALGDPPPVPVEPFARGRFT